MDFALELENIANNANKSQSNFELDESSDFTDLHSPLDSNDFFESLKNKYGYAMIKDNNTSTDEFKSDD